MTTQVTLPLRPKLFHLVTEGPARLRGRSRTYHAFDRLIDMGSHASEVKVSVTECALAFIVGLAAIALSEPDLRGESIPVLRDELLDMLIENSAERLSLAIEIGQLLRHVQFGLPEPLETSVA